MVKEQLALAQRIVIEDVPRFVGRNVQMVQPDFPIFDAGKRVGQTGASGAQRLHFRSRQDHPRLVRVFQMILKTGTAVGRHHFIRVSHTPYSNVFQVYQVFHVFHVSLQVSFDAAVW